MTSDRLDRRTLRQQLLQRHGDDGVALIAAIGVAVVCLMLATTVVAVAVRSSASTGAGRDRAQATAAAEAGLDSLSSVFGGPATEWLSTCAHQATTPPQVLTASSSVTTSTYATAVTFWSSQAGARDYRVPSKYWEVLDSLALSPSVVNTVAVAGDVPCLSGASAPYAQIDSRGTARVGSGVEQVQHMRAVVKLPLQTHHGLLGTTVDLSGASLATVSAGTSALDVRTGTGDLVCGDLATVLADVVVPDGKLVMKGECAVTGTVKAAAGVTTTPYLSRLTGTVATKLTAPSDPAWDPIPFPRITESLTAWTAQGFVVRPWPAGCTAAGFRTLTLAQTGPTIYDTRAACPSGLAPESFSTLRFTGGDAVLLVNAFTGGSNARITSDVTGRRLYIIAPAPPSGSPCPVAHDVMLDDFSDASTVKLFLYSPCTVTLGTSAAMTGQVWGGRVVVSSMADLTLADLGIPSTGGGATIVSKVFG